MLPVHIRPWRSWITQRIPIPENRGSNPFGRAKIIGAVKKHPQKTDRHITESIDGYVPVVV